MRVRFALLLLGLCFWLPAQTKVTVDKLVGMIRSSIQLKHSDKEVANYVRKLALSQRLDDRTIEELQGLGAGPKTVEALNALRDASKDLPAPPPVVVAPETPAPAPFPPPSPAEQRRVIDQAREFALGYTKNLPNYICTQVTRRYVDPSGLE